MRHVLTLVDGRVVVIAVLLLGASVIAAWVVRRRNGPATVVFVTATGSALIPVLTVMNRGIAMSRSGLDRDLTWWARHWSDFPGLVTGDPGWWLNVALFVPAALIGVATAPLGSTVVSPRQS